MLPAIGISPLGAARGVNPLITYLSTLVESGGVYWPYDDTGVFARAINPALVLGRNLVLNGGFDSDTIWVKPTGGTIAGGLAVFTAVANTANFSQNIASVQIGKTYEITYTVSGYSVGGVRSIAGGSNGAARSANGTYTDTLVLTINNGFQFSAIGTTTLNIDNVTIKQVNILASSVYPSAELLVDGNMEAIGVAAWTAGNSATLSKQTGTPHGGSQVLRVARNGVNNPSATQTILTIGKTYRVQGWMRSDGSAIPTIVGFASNITGTTSTSWQAFDSVLISIGTQLTLRAATSTGTQYCEFDDISITEVNPLTGRVSGALVNQDAGVRLLKAFSFDAINDFVNLYSADLNSAFNPAAGSIKIAGKKTAWDTTKRQFFIFAVDANNRVEVYTDTVLGDLVFRYVAGGTAKSVTVSSLTTTNNMLIEITWDTVADQMKAYINGAIQGTQTGLGVWVGNLAATTCTAGASSTSGGNPHNGYLSHPQLQIVAETPTAVLTAAQKAGVA